LRGFSMYVGWAIGSLAQLVAHYNQALLALVVLHLINYSITQLVPMPVCIQHLPTTLIFPRQLRRGLSVCFCRAVTQPHVHNVPGSPPGARAWRDFLHSLLNDSIDRFSKSSLQTLAPSGPLRCFATSSYVVFSGAGGVLR